VHLSGYPVEHPQLGDESLMDEMASVRIAVRLGHKARSAANVKLRQPLSEVIVATDDSRRREHVARHVDLVGGELGVKAVRLATSAEEFAEVEVMPLLKLLGPKYGRDLNLIRGMLREGEFRLDDGRVVVGDWTLEPGEYELRTRARDGFAVLDGDGFAVALDTEITPELELEGEARDLIRQVQVMRQDAGLEVTDRIRLVHPEGTVWGEHGAWIAEETLATEVIAGDQLTVERVPS
jgi:isoleucyl-tRNA synthetase